jgi:predicted small metal-binding protein
MVSDRRWSPAADPGCSAANERADARRGGRSVREREEKETDMTKTLKCGDLMPGCPAVVEGKDTGEVMRKAADHAAKAHGLKTIPPELAQKVQAAIRDK